MSEIDDIFARLGGGRITTSDGRDQRNIPRRGKEGGSRVVEVVHLTAGRPGVRAAVTRRTEPGVRAQSWDDGFPTRSAPPPSSPSAEPATTQAPDQVGHVVMGREPVAEVVLTSLPARAAVEIQPRQVDVTAAQSAGGDTTKQRRARPIADPFNPEDDRANCLRCGYAVEPGRERRGLTTCAACAA